MKISAVIIAYNEAEKIAAAVESVGWADEVVVVDSESADRTREIAASLGARVIIQKWLGFSAQKQFATDAAAHDWIFSLDADERASGQLKTEILRLKDRSEAEMAGGYKIPRLSYYLGRPIRHGGWYPDWQLRLFDRRKARWKEVLIHESVAVEGRVERLSGEILHFSVDDAAQHHRMIGERYAPLAAAQMYQNGRRASAAAIMAAGPAAFIRSYFLKMGFLDGLPGFCIARFAAHHAFLKHLLLWEKQQDKK